MRNIFEMRDFYKRGGEPIFFGERRIGRKLSHVSTAVFGVRRSKNYFRKMAGWSLDRSVLEDLRHEGIEKIVFDDKERNEIWSTPTRDFLSLGKLTENSTGLKCVLEDQRWTLVARGAQQIELIPDAGLQMPSGSSTYLLDG